VFHSCFIWFLVVLYSSLCVGGSLDMVSWCSWFVCWRLVRSRLMFMVSVLKRLGYTLSCTCFTILVSSCMAALWLVGLGELWSSIIHSSSVVSSCLTSWSITSCASVLSSLAYRVFLLMPFSRACWVRVFPSMKACMTCLAVISFLSLLNDSTSSVILSRL